MTSRFYRLPSLNALATFEAAARHRSIRRAADELNVTPGAVSRQVKALEEELGVILLERTQPVLSLTSAGLALHGVLADALRRTGDVLEAIRLERHAGHVTVACTHGFAKCWLMPRMNAFWRDHPDVCVNHLISDDGRDFRRPEVDLRIRYGFGSWQDETAVRLFDDLIYPVASPAFAERHAAATAADLPRLPLLHVDWVDPAWTGWDELLRAGTVPHAGLAGRRFSNFDVVLEACRDGQGVAVGWHRLVGTLVGKGDLVRFTDLEVPAPGEYHLTWNAGVALRGAKADFRDWLVSAAAEAGDASPASR